MELVAHLAPGAVGQVDRKQRARLGKTGWMVIGRVQAFVSFRGVFRHQAFVALGVPRFLTDGPSPIRVMAVGLLEQEAVALAESDPTGLYDWRVFTGPMTRPDPCEGLRRMMGSGRRALLDRPRPVGQQAVGAPALHRRIETPIDLPVLRQLVG